MKQWTGERDYHLHTYFWPSRLTSIHVPRPLLSDVMNTNPSNGKRHRCRYQLHQRVLDFKEYKYRRSKITEFETLLHSGSRTRRADHRRSSKHQSGAEWRSSTTLPELKAVWGGRGRGGASKHLNIWFRISLDVIRQYNIISINLRISHVDCQWLFLFLLSVEIIEIVSQFFFAERISSSGIIDRN